MAAEKACTRPFFDIVSIVNNQKAWLAASLLGSFRREYLRHSSRMFSSRRLRRAIPACDSRKPRHDGEEGGARLQWYVMVGVKATLGSRLARPPKQADISRTTAYLPPTSMNRHEGRQVGGSTEHCACERGRRGCEERPSVKLARANFDRRDRARHTTPGRGTEEMGAGTYRPVTPPTATEGRASAPHPTATSTLSAAWTNASAKALPTSTRTHYRAWRASAALAGPTALCIPALNIALPTVTLRIPDWTGCCGACLAGAYVSDYSGLATVMNIGRHRLPVPEHHAFCGWAGTLPVTPSASHDDAVHSDNDATLRVTGGFAFSSRRFPAHCLTPAVHLHSRIAVVEKFFHLRRPVVRCSLYLALRSLSPAV